MDGEQTIGGFRVCLLSSRRCCFHFAQVNLELFTLVSGGFFGGISVLLSFILFDAKKSVKFPAMLTNLMLMVTILYSDNT